MKDYDKFAVTFAKSRKNLKWPEIDFFMEHLNSFNNPIVLDVWCWSGRLVDYLNSQLSNYRYLWIDSSAAMLEEAMFKYELLEFLNLDMLELSKIDKKFDYIFLIASFHHLNSVEQRISVLKHLKRMLNNNWLIFMTNWNLLSEDNFEKYQTMYLWNSNFDIKIWEHKRYYHAFSVSELDILFNESNLDVVINKVFCWWRNIISILR